MKYMVISDDNEIGCAIDIKTNFETPLALYLHYLSIRQCYMPGIYDESFIEYAKTRIEIILNIEIDLFVIVMDGKIDVLERKI